MKGGGEALPVIDDDRGVRPGQTVELAEQGIMSDALAGVRDESVP